MLKTLTAFLVLGGLHLAIAKDAGGKGKCRDSALQIVPGAAWTATNTHEHVQAHGGGIIEVNGTYYLIGEDRSKGWDFENINCYSSENLVEWKFVQSLLSVTPSGDLGPKRVVERPKVIFNKRTKQYVMYMHIDDPKYKEARVGVATSDEVCGKYTFRRSFRPWNRLSRDIGLFQDDDPAQTGYLLSEDSAKSLQMYRLSPSYLDVIEHVHTWTVKQRMEAPAMIKRDGMYYALASRLTGRNFNDNKYSYAVNLKGPWSAWQNFAKRDSLTYASQTTALLPINENLVMFLGDRWDETVGASTYVWLPINFRKTEVLMPWAQAWSPVTGKVAKTLIEYNCTVAQNTNDAWQVKSGKTGHVGGENQGATRYLVESKHAEHKTMMIGYENPNHDFSTRYAGVSINGGAPQKIAFITTRVHKDRTGIAVVNGDFNKGRNDVVIHGLDGGWGPDVASVKFVDDE